MGAVERDDANTVAESTVPVEFATSPDFGSPEFASSPVGPDAALVDATAADLPASAWACTPAEVGPFHSTAVTAPFSCGAIGRTNAFDPNVLTATGNIWSALLGVTLSYAPLEMQPGQRGTIDVLFKAPASGHASNVSGFLALETFNNNTLSSDQIAQVPYRYRIG
jgi:hypothetical protein